MAIFAALVAIFSLLPFCYYASRITVKIQQTANSVFQSDWYGMPIGIQKNIKPIIAFAQIRRSVNGYGLLNSDLEGFLKVRNERISLKNLISY